MEEKQAETWNLGPLVAVFAPGQMSPQASEYKENIRDENDCIHAQLGQIMNKILKDQKANRHF